MYKKGVGIEEQTSRQQKPESTKTYIIVRHAKPIFSS